MIIFRLKEAMARYDVSVMELAHELRISQSAVSQWRQGHTKPDLDRLDAVITALRKIGDEDELKACPLTISVILEERIG